MSVFTNPASGAIEQGAAYTRATLDLLGDRDPLEVLRATPAALRRVVEEMSEADITMPEAPGKWSVRHVLRHLADCEIAWAFRFRMVLGQDRPSLTGFDQDGWAERFGYDESDAAEAVEEITVLRRANLRLLERTSDYDLQRVGVHAERGEESVAHMIRMEAGHDLIHLRQIERVRASI